ncbi:MAG: acetyl-CoA carboxylase, carboxyltransferase subunit beta [Verrucomicrobiota bacterium]
MSIFGKPRYSTVRVKKKDIPTGLWTKCPETGEIIYNKELEQNWMVVPNSGYHFPLPARRRFALLLDKGSFTEYDADLVSGDPLGFTDSKPYTARVAQTQSKTGEKDAVISATGKLDGMPVSMAVMDFSFIGASMGSVVGEKITRTIERGLEQKCPVIVVCASGGARMQEGILSLMQMAKTSAALQRLSEAQLPYISVLTNPTMAGVMASFASLGDVIISEPKALVGFAGPRVIKETTQQDLPDDFQTSEFLLEHGLVDQIVHRHEMKARLASLLRVFKPTRAKSA